MKKSLVVVIALLFFYRLIVLANSSLSFYSDDAIYAELARFLTELKFDKMVHPTWPPLYPFVSFLLFSIFGKWEIALQMVSVVSSVALLIVFYNFVKSNVTETAAIIGTLTLGFLSPFLKLSLLPLSDMLSTAVVVAGIICIYNCLNLKDRKWYFLAGILFGLTFLVRSEGTLFFALSLIYLCLYFFGNLFLKVEGKLQLAKKILLFCIAFVIVIFPYTVVTKDQLGSWTLSHKFSAQIKQGHSFQLRSGSTWSQEVVSVKYPNYKSEYFWGGTAHLLEYIDWYWWWFLQKSQNWLGVFGLLFPTWFFAISLLGWLRATKRNTHHLYFVFIIINAILITFFVTTIADIRYLLWSIPFLMYFFIHGVYILKNKIVSTFLLFVLILFLPSFDKSVIRNPLEYSQYFTKSNYREEIIQVSDWLNKNKTTQEPKIMMRHESVEFYTNGVTIYLPQQLTYNQTLDYARAQKTDYFVAWNEHLAGDNNLSFLLEDNANPSGLKKVFSTKVDGRNLILYEVLK